MEQRQSSFRASRTLEMEFRRRLRQVAQESRRMTAAGRRETAVINQLRQYGRVIGPWSRTVAENIVLKANRMNLREWNSMACRMHRALAAEYSSGGIPAWAGF